MPLSPSERTLRARLAAHTLHSKVDPTAHTAPARAAFLERFEREARRLHPDASDARIAKVAEHLKAAHFTRLAMKSAKARRKTGSA